MPSLRAFGKYKIRSPLDNSVGTFLTDRLVVWLMIESSKHAGSRDLNRQLLFHAVDQQRPRFAKSTQLRCVSKPAPCISFRRGRGIGNLTVRDIGKTCI